MMTDHLRSARNRPTFDTALTDGQNEGVGCVVKRRISERLPVSCRCTGLNVTKAKSNLRSPTGMTLGIAFNAIAICVMATLLPCGHGDMIRPMPHVMFVFVCGVLGIAVALPVSLRDLFGSSRRFSALLGVVLSLSPLPVGVATMHLIAHVRGFGYSP